ncbi:Uncharacterised protein [Yersinia similis]|uniref:Uncharacterized protein n=1 Tax=Yersinia similis TaxID=367190 RepID=A0A0T9R9A3_9GAMM|nr:Uncharacterised protein [Yersinia similis]CNG35201.1 Uncharacterised protein [Yersinia similis]CNI50561.1 Uncharacterised protein [Yersinia similis]
MLCYYSKFSELEVVTLSFHYQHDFFVIRNLFSIVDDFSLKKSVSYLEPSIFSLLLFFSAGIYINKVRGLGDLKS